ncbi:MAG: SRPBCC domain-containing protein [Chitinophagaceae bacterium]
METSIKTHIVKNLKEKSILVSTEFNAPIKNVWRAYTERELLDKWWGPSPWHAETKTMDFREGGFWLYAMVGPANEKHWGKMNYFAINYLRSIEIEDGFCDEEGVMNIALPTSKGSFVFTEIKTGTRVEFKMNYSSEKEVETLVEMGFEQGITTALGQLEGLLNTIK